jgi:hypothetical protein
MRTLKYCSFVSLNVSKTDNFDANHFDIRLRQLTESNHDNADVIPSLSRDDVHVTLKVYDILGREVATLVNERKPAGVYNVQCIMNNVSSGVYFYTLKAGSFTETKKMLLMK